MVCRWLECVPPESTHWGLVPASGVEEAGIRKVGPRGGDQVLRALPSEGSPGSGPLPPLASSLTWDLFLFLLHLLPP